MMKYSVLCVLVVLAVGMGCSADPVKKTIDKCEDKIISCVCGTGGGNITTPLKMCASKEADIGKASCVPCNKMFMGGDPCSRFEACESCQHGIPKCLSCPKENGKRGEFCSLGKVTMNKAISDEIKVKIPRGSSLMNKRLRRAGDPCTLPEGMETNEIDCVIRPSSTTCTQKCVYGHEFPEGRERTIHCDHDANVWTPTEVEECDPIINCHLVLTSAGETFCTSHMMDERTKCEIKCLEYGDEPEVPTMTYECHGNGLWSPELPFCVEVEEVDYH